MKTKRIPNTQQIQSGDIWDEKGIKVKVDGSIQLKPIIRDGTKERDDPTY